MRLVRLAILESYGVVWSLDTFARDVLQNFFDAAPDFRDVSITADTAAGTVAIRGPVEFDIDLLAYLGATTKTDGRSAGGFGEGFKICALVALRDFGLKMFAGSGETALEVVLAPAALGRELAYRVTATRGARGSYVRLANCTPAVFAAFARARDLFYHADNPKLGALIAADAESTVAVHEANLEYEGEIYYRRQFRGTHPFYASGEATRPLTIACHVVVSDLDSDRDRRNLDEYAVARVIGMRLPADALHRVILHCEHGWEHGNRLLHGFLAAAIERKMRFEWPAAWLARLGGKDDGRAALATRQGFRFAVSDFAALGMPTVADRFKFGLETRTPTPIEAARIGVAASLYAALLGKSGADEKEFGVFDDEHAAVLGQHLGDKLIVASKLLRRATFESATATVLHELSHEMGAEESDGFQHRLGLLLSAGFMNQPLLVATRARYRNARPARAIPSEEESVEAYAPEEFYDVNGGGDMVCTVHVPPAFPPTLELIERLVALRRVTRARFRVHIEACVSAGAAREAKLRGLPTVRFNDVEVAPVRGPIGYRLREYAGRAAIPTVAQLRAALRIARARREPAREPVVRSAPPVSDATDLRDAHVRQWVRRFAVDDRRRGLERAWLACQNAAAWTLFEDLVRDAKLTEAQLMKRIAAGVKAACVATYASRDKDPAFESGDRFEENAMAAAQGAFAAEFVTAGPRKRARARRAFLAVRAATRAVLSSEIAEHLRDNVLVYALGVARLPVTYASGARRLDLDLFRRATAYALREAQRLQQEADAQDSWPPNLFDRTGQPTPDVVENAGARTRVLAAERKRAAAREERTHALRTLAVKNAYDEGLAKTGSKLIAARHCVTAARKLLGARR